ncbi:NADPH-dependent FMN reductase [Paenibacillus sinopodophylli]|uniref:NADPH-dependent FMN reductase n=1 Tax=Paenibacillus sinopodophylli TaxID=1837342 RepID=UPI00110D1C55|nr:NADPH-dependent FMN reductase [Paenibacillus sinopodophylli]
MSKKIGLIVGSLRKDSYNRMVAQKLAELDASVSFQWIELKDLPLFNEDLEKGEGPEAVSVFKSAIQAVDGVIIVSPEYNSGIPGVLKNAIDWASRPSRTSVLRRKPIGLIGATPGGMGTINAQLQTRHILESVQAQLLPFQKLHISQIHLKVDAEQHRLTDEKTKEYLQAYLQKFIHWIDHIPTLE